jgi:hypothetical protein
VAVALALPLLGACGSDDAAAGGDRPPDLGGETAPQPPPGGETAPQPPPGATELLPTGLKDLCVLLEDSEIEEQFGGPVPPAEGAQFHCSWSIDDPRTGTTTDVSVNTGLVRRGMSIEAAWAEALEVEDGETMLPGIGDDAYIVDDTILGRALTFRFGDTVLSVSTRIYDRTTGTDEKLIALAKLIIERL